MRAIDLTGTQYGRLTVLREAPKIKGNANRRWKCKCECGSKPVIFGGSLRSGASTSCGCYRAENNRVIPITHGFTVTHHHECHVWYNMMDRCTNKENAQWDDYGGRGIRVCRRWSQPDGVGLAKFIKDMEQCPEGYEIDRRDNEGDYRRSNCRWVTRLVNARNKRNSKR